MFRVLADSEAVNRRQMTTWIAAERSVKARSRASGRSRANSSVARPADDGELEEVMETDDVEDYDGVGREGGDGMDLDEGGGYISSMGVRKNAQGGSGASQGSSARGSGRGGSLGPCPSTLLVEGTSDYIASGEPHEQINDSIAMMLTTSRRRELRCYNNR